MWYTSAVTDRHLHGHDAGPVSGCTASAGHTLRRRCGGPRYLSRYSPPPDAGDGLICTGRDIAKFIVALRKGNLVVQPETLALAWRTPVAANGLRSPHGLGWFVQSYNGETIVWQYGLSQGASSSLIVTVPGRGVTLVLLANSDGLSWSFPLAAGDLNSSPFGRLFLGLFVR